MPPTMKLFSGTIFHKPYSTSSVGLDPFDTWKWKIHIVDFFLLPRASNGHNTSNTPIRIVKHQLIQMLKLLERRVTLLFVSSIRPLTCSQTLLHKQAKHAQIFNYQVADEVRT